jgi:hypothetical protein
MKITYHGQEGDKLRVSINDGDILFLTTDELYTLAAIDEKQTQEELDWQSLRNQVAVAAMQGMLSNPQSYLGEGDTYPKAAVRFADALIEELRKER